MSVVIHDEKWSWKNISLQQFIEEKNYPLEWESFFTKKEVQQEIKKISDYLQDRAKDVNIFPEIDKVFRALLPPEKIKVVILGQDPYHNKGSAVGLAFSVPSSAYINPSLKNIYKELENEKFSPVKDGNLNRWKNQGVLLLNTALTVEESSPGSHAEIWTNFTKQLLAYVGASRSNQIAWLLMGRHAINYKSFILPFHKIFMTSHPSPLGATKTMGDIPAFLGSDVFKKINEFLKEKILW